MLAFEGGGLLAGDGERAGVHVRADFVGGLHVGRLSRLCAYFGSVSVQQEGRTGAQAAALYALESSWRSLRPDACSSWQVRVQTCGAAVTLLQVDIPGALSMMG